MLFEGTLTRITHGEGGASSLRLTLAIPEHLDIEPLVKSSQVQDGKIIVWLRDDIEDIEPSDEFSSDIELIQKRLDGMVEAVSRVRPDIAPALHEFIQGFIKDTETMYEAAFNASSSDAKKRQRGR